MTRAGVDERIERLLREGARATVFVPVPAGTFLMGSSARADEGPIHEVTVGNFSASITPVSNVEYAEFLRATGHEPPRFWDEPRFNAPDQPVCGVNWFDATDYCEWLSELLGRTCRLPTEAEREWAALGGVRDGRPYPWGNEPWTEGPFALVGGTDRPMPIGSAEANGYGLYHMCENVHEWCTDWYAPYVGAAAVNPTGPLEGTRKTSRGGSWRHSVKVNRIQARSSLDPGRRYNDYGFRVYADA